MMPIHLYLKWLKLNKMGRIGLLVLLQVFACHCADASLVGHLGCYLDKGHNERAVWEEGESVKITNNQMTIEYCVKRCREGRYKYSGVEHKDECFCGNNDDLMRYSGGKKINQRRCNQKCAGNKQQICGGDWTMNVYLTGNCSSDWLMTNGSVVRVDKHQGPFLFGDTVSVQCHAGDMVLGPKTAVCTNNPKKPRFAVAWNNTLQCTGIPGYVGCFAATDLRDTINMTVQEMDSSICTEYCNRTADYELAAVRHHYCYCGHDNLLGAAGGNCTLPCTGDITQICGGETSVSVYRVRETEPTTARTAAADQTTSLPVHYTSTVVILGEAKNTGANSQTVIGATMGVVVPTVLCVSLVLFILYRRKHGHSTLCFKEAHNDTTKITTFENDYTADPKTNSNDTAHSQFDYMVANDLYGDGTSGIDSQGSIENKSENSAITRTLHTNSNGLYNEETIMTDCDIYTSEDLQEGLHSVGSESDSLYNKEAVMMDCDIYVSEDIQQNYENFQLDALYAMPAKGKACGKNSQDKPPVTPRRKDKEK